MATGGGKGEKRAEGEGGRWKARRRSDRVALHSKRSANAQSSQDLAGAGIPELDEVVLGSRDEQAFRRVPFHALDVPSVTCRHRVEMSTSSK